MLEISVITPVYNGEKFIECCILSVIQQRCLHVEHIIIDGGSTDKTVEIIQEYANKYPHIRCISERDKGQSDAMNKGVGLAKGKIIGFLNVDDFYEANVLNRVLELFSNLPTPSFVAANCNIIDSLGRIRGVNKPKKLQLHQLILGPNINPAPANPSAYFYHKSVHTIVGLYKIDEHYAMDLDFILRAVQVAKIKYIDEIWGNFRFIQGTKSFQDVECDQFSQRYQSILIEYKKSLSWLQRWRIFWIKEIWMRIQYYYRHPQDLISSLLKKIGFPSISGKL